jgi:hypothetical protein
MGKTFADFDHCLVDAMERETENRYPVKDSGLGKLLRLRFLEVEVQAGR